MPYTVAITGTGVARMAGRTVPAQSFAVMRVYNPKVPPSGKPDVYSDYVVFSNHNGQIKDSTKVYGHPEYGGKGVYVNGRLRFRGKPEVYGDIRVTGRFHDLRKVGPWPPGQYKRQQRVPREPMPTVDLAYYKSIADEIHSGDLRIDGRKHTNTSLQKPRIIYVDGRVELKGNLEGYGIIVATKGVRIDGDVKYGSSQSGWAIISAGTVKIKHDAEVHGGIYAHSTKKHKARVEVEGNAKVFGWVVADTVKLKKKAIVEYDPGIKNMQNLPGGTAPTDKPVVDLMFWGAL
jgi:cytoskeletal protein CcmA (bactofilin family)